MNDKPDSDNSKYVEEAKKRIKEQLSLDDFIRKLVSMESETKKAENTLFKALFDTYFLYFPEAANLIKDKEAFISALSKGVKRDEISSYLGISADSMGYNLSDSDLSAITDSFNQLVGLSGLRTMIELKIDSILEENYINLFKVAGPDIAAKLISLSGSLKNLSEMPSGKLQVLGAEKSIFGGKKAKTPKYGVIFFHPEIQAASDKLKGRIARVVASKTSLAAKVDFFSKEDKSGLILKKMRKEVDKIKNGT
jgi:nucleolar protein 56